MKIVVLPCLFDNYAYLVVCEETGDVALVDPAEFYPIYKEVERTGINLRAIYCTHHHADHIGGLADLLKEIPGLPVYGHESDKRRIPGMTHPLEDGSKIRIGNITGKVLHTPGHTKGSVCYLLEDVLFTGDTMFGAGCGRLFEGYPQQMYDALNHVIKPLPPQTKIYFGHEYTVNNLKFAGFVEPDNDAIAKRMQLAVVDREKGVFTSPSTLEIECQTNPFLRCAEQSVIDSVAVKFVGGALDPLSVFTALRQRKDNF